ncbi:protein-tyrosine phosphatase [Salsuginibacillus halophilus]|uniref:protein-tyrosine-phosphatase n=1 Tax=Salsuginibacillus halophilus TaxID=517424 RepID=A0A2P8HY60_9BACI|nr:low molecular weight protein-tyrosine-phosphatase [Salsuginibacillus halophilus]PSL51127.1 protein-tyrosine phosphatase [Salsuginibacillus halophilus]
MIRVLFVCLGNICRSPMAEAVFRHKVEAAGLHNYIEIDSAGTGSWHIGNPPHPGTEAVLTENSIKTDGLKARQLKAEDTETFDYIVTMDSDNLTDTAAVKTNQAQTEISRLLEFHPDLSETDVEDPYLTGNFTKVYNMVTESCDYLLEHIRGRENL